MVSILLMSSFIHAFILPADRAKQIQNFAKINTDSTEKIIRNLKEENEKLKRLLEQETAISASASPTEYYGMILFVGCRI